MENLEKLIKEDRIKEVREEIDKGIEGLVKTIKLLELLKAQMSFPDTNIIIRP